MVCDGHNDEITKKTPWTTACECYDFCAPKHDTGDILFQRNNEGMCQCLKGDCESQTNCGLESDCQIFQVRRYFDCCGTDWTLGMNLESEYLQNETKMMDFFTDYADSIQEKAFGPKVISHEFIETASTIRDLCIPAFMCPEHEWSFGEADPFSDDPVSSPCFRCNVNSETELRNRTVNGTRCDMARNDGIRYHQDPGYYARAEGRDPLVLNDYCGCEIECRLDKFKSYYDGECEAVNGMAGYTKWLNNPKNAFAVDSYKGDCRCWDYCVPNTTWQCTTGTVDRCLDPVAVLFLTKTEDDFSTQRKY